VLFSNVQEHGGIFLYAKTCKKAPGNTGLLASIRWYGSVQFAGMDLSASQEIFPFDFVITAFAMCAVKIRLSLAATI
jgi:hypothetical protein